MVLIAPYKILNKELYNSYEKIQRNKNTLGYLSWPEIVTAHLRNLRHNRTLYIQERIYIRRLIILELHKINLHKTTEHINKIA
jgi:hypothetical protein